MGSYTCHTPIPDKGIDVSTTNGGGSVVTVIQRAGLTLVDKGASDPALIRTISTPLGTVDTQTQHDQSVADVRAGLYGDFHEIDRMANEESEGTS